MVFMLNHVDSMQPLVRMIILLFLLVFSCSPTQAGPAWKCPEISEESGGVEISCSCEIAHTLRSAEKAVNCELNIISLQPQV